MANPSQAGELAGALVESADTVEILSSPGGEDALAMFQARRPQVVVMASMLEAGDAKSLMALFGSILPRSAVGFVLIGDDRGPVRTATDAIDYAPDGFVPRPVVASALRIAVQSALEAVSRRNRVSATLSEVPGDAAEACVAQHGRWEALTDIIAEPESDEASLESSDIDDEAPLLPPLFEILPRRDHEPIIVPIESWGHEASDAAVLERVPTYTVRDAEIANSEPQSSRGRPPTSPPPIPAIRSRGFSDAPPRARPALRAKQAAEDDWSEPTPLSEVGERAQTGSLVDEVLGDDPLDAIERDSDVARVSVSDDVAELEDPDLIVPTAVPSLAHDDRGAGQDFARQLRAKMSLMAKRLFQSDGDIAQPIEVEPVRPETDVDLAALGDVDAVDRGGVTTIERASADRRERSSPNAVGSWTTQVRERGLPDAGELVRGVSDAAVVLASLFNRGMTGRVSFRLDDVEKVVFVDAGRPVFASSNAPGDRMGELLVREGKITAAQYDRCQADVLRTGRRIGEILIDFGYLKRRELLPAVRRHVEDIVFSLFGWARGHYQIAQDTAASSERIRMSRHPASLVLEGIRRKLDRATLERLVGPPSTILDLTANSRSGAAHRGEVWKSPTPDESGRSPTRGHTGKFWPRDDTGKSVARDGAGTSGFAPRDALSSVINASDLSDEERAALAAFDGRNDLAAVARAAGVDVADVLPLAWGLCVLGVATARRADTDEPSAVLVGESDLAIDRERIRARWELVTEADYFALLGVRRDATAFEIRRAYQLACRDFAADGFPLDLRRELSRELAEIATVLDEAYRVMRDDQLRVMYLSHLPQ